MVEKGKNGAGERDQEDVGESRRPFARAIQYGRSHTPPSVSLVPEPPGRKKGREQKLTAHSVRTQHANTHTYSANTHDPHSWKINDKPDTLITMGGGKPPTVKIVRVPVPPVLGALVCRENAQ